MSQPNLAKALGRRASAATCCDCSLRALKLACLHVCVNVDGRVSAWDALVRAQLFVQPAMLGAIQEQMAKTGLAVLPWLPAEAACVGRGRMRLAKGVAGRQGAPCSRLRA